MEHRLCRADFNKSAEGKQTQTMKTTTLASGKKTSAFKHQ